MDFLYTRIPRGIRLKFPGELGLARTRHFLTIMGSPQEKIKVVHIAGTSGKGSTAYLVSRLLAAHGFKVGLHLSPHLTDIRERFQVNNRFLSREKWLNYFNEVGARLEKVDVERFGQLTYFELLVSLAYHIFAREGVGYAVMETGLGGRFDATNVVSNRDKLAAITTIGIDHAQILGKRIADIAGQKSGIIGKGNLVVTVENKRKALEVIEKEAHTKRTKVVNIKYRQNYETISLKERKVLFDFRYPKKRLENIKLTLLGRHQVRNAALALGILSLLGGRDGFELSEQMIRESLSTAMFPGRLEIRQIDRRKVIIDGAHNPQKMQALMRTLAELYPGRKFDFLIAFKKGKDYGRMLRMIVRKANSVFVGSFFTANQDLAHISADPQELIRKLQVLGFHKAKAIPTDKQAVRKVLSGKGGPLVITGSLYYIGEVYPWL